ncbi:MAG: ECF transporter S component [Candidatus Bathyarchaeia archaeon]
MIAIAAVMTALVCVTTMFFMLPIPATDGFFNLGDAIVMIAALTFGPTVGAIAGGIGSSLADLLGGWYVWVIPTLVIKGAEGFIAGWIFSKSKNQSFQKTILAWIVGGLVMVSGYFMVQVFMYGFEAALVEAPFNFVQMAMSGIIGVPISQALKRRIGM